MTESLQEAHNVGNVNGKLLINFKKAIDIYERLLCEEWIDIDSIKKEAWMTTKNTFPISNSNINILKANDISFGIIEGNEVKGYEDCTCNICHTDIWNRHLLCEKCTTIDKTGDDIFVNTYNLCIHCYALGYGCEHKRFLTLVEHFSINSLKKGFCEAIETWNKVIRSNQLYSEFKYKPNIWIEM
jgi:hypothetical protein